MSKTRKFLTTLTMVAVATTTNLTAISSAQAHPSGPPHLHAIPTGPIVPGPGPIYTGPLLPFPGPLTPTPPAPPPPAPPHKHGGLKPGQAAALGAVGGLLVGTIIANSAKKQPVPAAGLPTEHYLYCDKKYKTYVIATNTFTGYDGLQHYCNSPWSY
jgi:hypothetical protein